ncbi:hypothetical protein HYQ46_009956 [Verticillium longisporum]|nr:hypothetical protein HYQ46_009956 [Verticillium longisporum]
MTTSTRWPLISTSTGMLSLPQMPMSEYTISRGSVASRPLVVCKSSSKSLEKSPATDFSRQNSMARMPKRSQIRRVPPNKRFALGSCPKHRIPSAASESEFQSISCRIPVNILVLMEQASTCNKANTKTRSATDPASPPKH